METPNTFDLNRAITTWTQQLSESPAIHADNLEELESHLRDAVEELQTRGLSTEEAFVLATHRLGPAEPVQAEFTKVNPGGVWLHRVLWMLVGVQVWALIGGVSRLAADAALIGGASVAGPGFAPTSLTLSSTLLPGGLFLATQLLTVLLIIGVGWLLLGLAGRTRRSADKRSISLSLLVLVVVGAWLATLGLQASSLLMPQLSIRLLSVEQFGVLAYSKSLASLGLFVVQTVIMAIVTVLLAMRLFRSEANARVKSQ